jgi:hypothetical protein
MKRGEREGERESRRKGGKGTEGGKGREERKD